MARHDPAPPRGCATALAGDTVSRDGRLPAAARVVRLLSAVVGGAMRGLIRVYQLTLSPLIGPVCRFEPSCSRYAAEAIARHGPLRGGWLAAHRLCRCHPWGGSGLDPVPPAPCAARPTRGAPQP